MCNRGLDYSLSKSTSLLSSQFVQLSVYMSISILSSVLSPHKRYGYSSPGRCCPASWRWGCCWGCRTGHVPLWCGEPLHFLTRFKKRVLSEPWSKYPHAEMAAMSANPRLIFRWDHYTLTQALFPVWVINESEIDPYHSTMPQRGHELWKLHSPDPPWWDGNGVTDEIHLQRKRGRGT